MSYPLYSVLGLARWVLRYYLVWLSGQCYGIPIAWDGFFFLSLLMTVYNLRALWTSADHEELHTNFNALIYCMQSGKSVTSYTADEMKVVKKECQKKIQENRRLVVLLDLGILFLACFSINAMLQFGVFR